ncbi:hypothetical protein PG997_001671 [Apiospora hydei]|uniref:Uncharacterized protein n=1 Tax=Apiospora hydei TaxID=1337664 RepID=A0ABR1XE56_9PEZI
MVQPAGTSKAEVGGDAEIVIRRREMYAYGMSLEDHDTPKSPGENSAKLWYLETPTSPGPSIFQAFSVHSLPCAQNAESHRI